MATSGRAAFSPWTYALAVLAVSTMLSCGGGGGGYGGGGGGSAPSAPTGLVATAGDKQVGLTWSASSTATSYNVKRATTSGGPYTTVNSPATTSYTDPSLTDGTKYYYVVSAVNSYGESGNSSEANATPALAIPVAPTGLVATAGDKQVGLTWTASAGAASYNVKRSTTSGSEVTISSPTSASYTDSTGLADGTKYYYEVSAVNAAGESVNSSEVNATPNVVPAAPAGLTATAGNAQVVLAWSASAGAASYNVYRGTVSGGPYTKLSSSATTGATDSTVTNGTTYYYVVTAVNSAGESGFSNQAKAIPSTPPTIVHLSVDVLTNRHDISPYVYGGSYPKDAATVTDSGLSVVRWGGNATSTYNWQLHTYNADNDYFWEDFNSQGFNDGSNGDSTQFITAVKSAGSNPLMTMPMLGWVAKGAEVASPANGHWSFSVAKYGAQCSVDQFNTDAGNGQQTNCSTPLATNADPNDAYLQLLDDHSGTCILSGTCVYRNDWAAALATAFGSAPHFYNLDNEIDIWGGTHRDIHPLEAGYNELRDTYLSEARLLKIWDPAAIRLGPVSCCWYFYWNLNSSTDNKSTHAGIDFLPWWLNEVAWSDAVANKRSLDIFDIHAYPDADTSGLTQTQLRALATSVYRDWWDPTYTSAAAYIRNGGFSIEPADSKPFRIPRMRAVVNSTYPGTPFAITEWSAEFAGNTSQARAADFSTALGDADAYGILGRERVYLASRWTAPDPANPNYLALKLYTNYDGSHHGFATTSVTATSDGDPSLFSSYAAVNAAGTQMTVMVLNKDPAHMVSGQFAFNGFTPTSVVSYTLASTAPTVITSSASAWSSTQSFAPYTATLLVITGTTTATPASSWDLNPDTIMVAAGGTVTLSPKIISGTANVSLTNAQSDNGITVTVTQGNLTTSQNGTITIVAGSTPGFYHYSVQGTDSGAMQTQGGYIVVGRPAATIAKTSGDGQTGTHGTTLPTPLTVTLSAGSSGGTNTGASVLFSTSAGSLSNGTTTGLKVIAVTNSSGVASVTLTLPSTAETVTVTAEGPYGLGHPVATFTETSN